jgi:hypothetical protein
MAKGKENYKDSRIVEVETEINELLDEFLTYEVAGLLNYDESYKLLDLLEIVGEIKKCGRKISSKTSEKMISVLRKYYSAGRIALSTEKIEGLTLSKKTVEGLIEDIEKDREILFYRQKKLEKLIQIKGH